MRFLCATDLLPKSEAAIERAGMLADRLAAELSLLHVVAPSECERALESELQSAIARLRARARPPLWRCGVSPSVMVQTGTPAQRIVESIADTDADLVVLGPHRNRGLRDALGGTIADRILRARSTSVLIVQGEPRRIYRNIVLAMDLSRVSAEALRTAERLVVTPEANAVILHAHEPPYDGMLTNVGIAPDAVEGYRAGWSRHSERAVRDFLAQHSRDSGRYKVILAEARPAVAVLHAATRIQPDLLVMGTHGRGRVARAITGSVASTVLRDAKSDILIVPGGSIRAQPAKSSRGRSASRVASEVVPGV